MTRLILIYLGLSVTLGGCVQPGAALFRAHPELRPGETSWTALKSQWSKAKSAKAPPATLAGLVRRAVQENPKVLAAWETWRARTEAVSGAGLPPRPQLSYTWLPLPVETRVGPNEHRVALTQKIPSPFVLSAAHKGAVSAADAAGYAYERAVLETVAEVKSLSAEVRYLQQAVRAIGISQQLAEQLVTAAQERLEGSAGTLFDVSKARSQLAQLHYDRIRFVELLEATTGRLNAVLDQDAGAVMAPLAPWPAGLIPDRVEPLYEQALDHDPEIKRLDAQIKGRMAGVDGAWGKLFPDLTVGAQYLFNGPAQKEGLQDSGQDALGITVGLSLPLWFGREQAQIGSADAALSSAVAAKRAHVNDLLAAIKDEYLRARNARRLVALYDVTLLPEARKALGDADAWRRAGTGGFTDLLEARNVLHRYTLARERAVADAIQAEAHLELLIAGPLPTGGN